MIFRADIEGAEQLAAALQSIGDTLAKKVVKDALLKGGELVAARARQLAPVGDGMRSARVDGRVVRHATPHLKDTIIVTTKLNANQRRGRKLTGWEVFIGSTAPHAHLVEFGHRLVKGKTRKGTVVEQTFRRIKSGPRKGQYVAVVKKRRNDAVRGRYILTVQPHPFIRPALDEMRSAVLARMGEDLSVALADLGQQLEAKAGTSRLGATAKRMLLSRRV